MSISLLFPNVFFVQVGVSYELLKQHLDVITNLNFVFVFLLS